MIAVSLRMSAKRGMPREFFVLVLVLVGTRSTASQT